MGLPSGVSFNGPSCSSSAAHGISSVTFNVKSSIVRFSLIAVEVIVSPLIFRFVLPRGWNRSLPRTALPLCMFLHPVQLMPPVTLERAGPLVQRTDRLRVYSVEHPASLPACIHQPNVQQHTQML